MQRTTTILSFFILLTLSLIYNRPAGAQNEQQATSAQLIAHWKFDEGQGLTANDSSGNGYHGTITNAAWSTDVPPAAEVGAYSLKFDGNSWVDTAVFDINDTFTIAAWIQIEAINNRAIIGKHTAAGGNQFLFGLYSGGYHLNMNEDRHTGAAPAMPEWHHIVLAGEPSPQGRGTIVTLYRNGVKQSTFKVGNWVGDTSFGKPWTIGRDWDGDTTNDFFVGKIADLRIYDSSLGENEISELAAGIARTCSVPTEKETLADALADNECLTIELAAGEYEVDQIVPNYGFTLRGTGREETVMQQGFNKVRFFTLNNHTTIEHLTLRNAQGVGTGEDDGGAILNQEGGVLTINDVAFIRNRTSASGGAIYNAGMLVVRDSAFIGNGAGSYRGSGGAIYNDLLATLTVDNSLFRENEIFIGFNNTVGGGGGALENMGRATVSDSTIVENNSGSGGAVQNRGDLTISNTIIDDNIAFGRAGGIFNRGNLILEYSSVSGNQAEEWGGGILNYKQGVATVTGSTIANNSVERFNRQASGIDNWGQITIINSTISGNSIPGQSPPLDEHAVIQQHWFPSSLTLIHTTIADNEPQGASNVFGVWVTTGDFIMHNTLLAGNGSSNCQISTANKIEWSGNIADDVSCSSGASHFPDLSISPLGDNGGPTLTHALGESSPARDAGDPAFCESVDQRGVARAPEQCDAGAYEVAETGPSSLYLPLLRNR